MKMVKETFIVKNKNQRIFKCKKLLRYHIPVVSIISPKGETKSIPSYVYEKKFITFMRGFPKNTFIIVLGV